MTHEDFDVTHSERHWNLASRILVHIVQRCLLFLLIWRVSDDIFGIKQVGENAMLLINQKGWREKLSTRSNNFTLPFLSGACSQTSQTFQRKLRSDFPSGLFPHNFLLCLSFYSNTCPQQPWKKGMNWIMGILFILPLFFLFCNSLLLQKENL